MENQIQLFEHERFGKVRIVIIGGRIHFVAADVCRALDIKNPRDALTRLDDDEKQSIILPNESSKDGVTNSVGSTDGNDGATSGWLQNRVNVVNEPGLYRLIFSSRKKEALEFQRWVYHEVLPSINKTGSYSVVKKTKRTPNPNRRAGQLSDASVYVFQMSDGSIVIVKIGQSKNADKRKAEVERHTKKTVENMYCTPLLPRKVARLIEKACHEIFSSSKLGGEFFSVKFEEACKVVNAFVKFVASFPQISNFERSEKLLAIVNEIKTLSGNQTEERAILINSAKLIAGN